MEKDEYKLIEKEVLVRVKDVLKSVDEDLLLESILYKADSYSSIIDTTEGKLVFYGLKEEIRDFVKAYNKLFNKNIKIMGDENERKTETNVNQPSNAESKSE